MVKDSLSEYTAEHRPTSKASPSAQSKLQYLLIASDSTPKTQISQLSGPQNKSLKLEAFSSQNNFGSKKFPNYIPT
jgi:hypothetical protein